MDSLFLGAVPPQGTSGLVSEKEVPIFMELMMYLGVTVD